MYLLLTEFEDRTVSYHMDRVFQRHIIINFINSGPATDLRNTPPSPPPPPPPPRNEGLGNLSRRGESLKAISEGTTVLVPLIVYKF